jgi:hypothetical protein
VRRLGREFFEDAALEPAHVFPVNRRAGGAVLDEFQRPEGAVAADFADDGVLLGKSVEARLETVPAKVLGQAFPDSRKCLPIPLAAPR